jgi:hypothetical protein
MFSFRYGDLWHNAFSAYGIDILKIPDRHIP